MFIGETGEVPSSLHLERKIEMCTLNVHFLCVTRSRDELAKGRSLGFCIKFCFAVFDEPLTLDREMVNLEGQADVYV